MARIGSLLNTALVCSAVLQCSLLAQTTTACGSDGCEQANNHAVILDDIFEKPPILPNDASEAFQSFDKRASKLLEYAACQTNESPNSGYIGALNTNFGWNPGLPGQGSFYGLESWGRDALAKLAYPGDCADLPAALRYQVVDTALSQISIPGDLYVGSSVDPVIDPLKLTTLYQRHGDLDSGLKELIPIVYLYKERIPRSYAHILDVLSHAVANNSLIIGSPPTYDLNILGTGVARLPETENHTLLELSEQYLVNQILNREFSSYCAHLLSGCVLPPGQTAVWDNSHVHDYLMQLLRGILTSDFFEYNAKPYQHYSLYAMENLADFAADSDVSTAAKMVLDFAGAKFAVSSNLLRRSSPYRRRGSHDGNLFTGSRSDEQLCRFFLYSGQLQAIFANGAYSAPSGCISAIREVVSNYRMPYPIVEMAIAKNIPYLQTFSGGPNYFANMFGSDANNGLPVPGAVEVYDSEPSFLIAAGGIPQPNGLPAKANGALLNLEKLSFFTQPILQFVTGNPPSQYYSTSDEDVGISLPTLLIPNDVPADPADRNAVQPIVDRTQLVRIDGIGHQDANLCVAPGFACGKNPKMPNGLRGYIVDGPWQFGIVSSVPVDTYVSVLTAPAYLVSNKILQQHPNCNQTLQWPFQIGLFEAEPANKFASFDEFRSKVKSNNPAGADVFVEIDGYTSTIPFDAKPNNYCSQLGGSAQGQPGPSGGTYLVTGWNGQYTKTDGAKLIFSIPTIDWDVLPRDVNGATVNPVLPPPFQNYGVQSSSLALPNADPAAWSLANGPVQGTHLGVITITSPLSGNSCRLDISDIHNPQRSCSAIKVPGPKQGSDFIIQDAPAPLGFLSGLQGNFEMVVPEGGSLVHYWRDNNAGFPWHLADYLVKEPPATSESLASTTFRGTSLLQSQQGNLEAVAWLHSKPTKAQALGGGAVETDYLASFYRDASTLKWYGPFQITVDGTPVTGVTGAPAFIQDAATPLGFFSGLQGNFEMVVPEGGSLVHYWRDNNTAGSPWHLADYLVKEPPATSESLASTTVRGAALLQSRQGNFEVVAWLHSKPTAAQALGGGTVETDYLASFYRDASTLMWYGPFQITVDGTPVTGVTGTPALIQSTSGSGGNFEMVVPEGGSLVHYWRDNNTAGFPWHLADYLVKEPPPTSESLASTTFRGTSLLQSQQGNLEVVAWLHSRPTKAQALGGGGVETDYLASFYRDASTLKWYGPLQIAVEGNLINYVSGLR